jgi:hypothetical protein
MLQPRFLASSLLGAAVRLGVAGLLVANAGCQ